MPIVVTFTEHRTVRVVCGDETVEVPLPDAPPRQRWTATPPADATVDRRRARDALREAARLPVIGLVRDENARTALRPEAYALALEQAVAASPVPLDDIEDFNVTNLSMRAIEDDVRDDADAKHRPLVLDVLVDPAALDREIALERLRRIVNDRSNPIDAIRLLGPAEAR